MLQIVSNVSAVVLSCQGLFGNSVSSCSLSVDACGMCASFRRKAEFLRPENGMVIHALKASLAGVELHSGPLSIINPSPLGVDKIPQRWDSSSRIRSWPDADNICDNVCDKDESGKVRNCTSVGCAYGLEERTEGNGSDSVRTISRNSICGGFCGSRTFDSYFEVADVKYSSIGEDIVDSRESDEGDSDEGIHDGNVTRNTNCGNSTNFSRRRKRSRREILRHSASRNTSSDHEDEDEEEERENDENDSSNSDTFVPNIPRPTWVLHTPARGSTMSCPGPRAGHALVSHSGFVFMFGGYCMLVADGRASAAADRSLESIAGYSASVIGGHALENLSLEAAAEDGLAFTFSDKVASGQHGRLTNSVYQYDIEGNEWICLSPHTENDQRCPKPRRHATVVVHGGSLFVHGGFDTFDAVLGDLWEFKLERRRWCRIMYTGRGRASQPYMTTSGHFLGESYSLHTEAHAIHVRDSDGNGLQTSSTFVGNRPQVPGPRAEHTAVVYGNMMIVFGGYDGKKKLNDTYVFDFASRDWSRPLNGELNAPSRRCKHSAVIYQKQMYVLGGFQIIDGANYALTDIHMLNLETYTWTPLILTASTPDGLQGHKAFVVGDSMYVFGGKVRGHLSDVRDMNGSGLLTKVLRFRFDVNRWSVMETSGSGPPPRQLHAAAAVPRGHCRESIFVFGGSDKGKHCYFDDLWELQDIRRTSHEDALLPCDVCSSTKALINNPLFSDVRFLVENRVVYAHRCILYGRSDYFRNMFEAGMCESRQDEISVTDVSYNVFLSVMEHLYTGSVTMKDGRVAVDLLKAADMFGLDALRAKCMERVETAVTVANAAFICEVADIHNADALKRFCIAFILHNFKEVINTEAWADLQRRDSKGLGREILNAFTDSAEFDPTRALKRPRIGGAL